DLVAADELAPVDGGLLDEDSGAFQDLEPGERDVGVEVVVDQLDPDGLDDFGEAIDDSVQLGGRGPDADPENLGGALVREVAEALQLELEGAVARGEGGQLGDEPLHG